MIGRRGLLSVRATESLIGKGENRLSEKIVTDWGARRPAEKLSRAA